MTCHFNEKKHCLLDSINYPLDLRKLSVEQLPQLCAELREDIINVVSKTGGHLGAGLGVIELTVALHYVFNTPYDRLVWDVGHQTYPHKILTGRRKNMPSLRKVGGLSGFTKRSESEYDPFGAGHASTSISAALGMAVAQDLDKKLTAPRNVVAIIGDGAMSGGMVYEAMNNAAEANARLIIILNDNDMSIAPPVGAMAKYLTRLVSSPSYRNFREKVKYFSNKFPNMLRQTARHFEEIFRSILNHNANLFEELGFYYVGPIDGHDINHLIKVLSNIKEEQKGPVFIHAVTHKGKGYAPAEAAPDKLHGVTSFDLLTGAPISVKKDSVITYTDIFAQSLIKEAKKDEKIIAITAAMPSGTGLNLFGQLFKDRMFDVAIAEQHAVTFAAGLAAEGYKPFVAIYSTFLQRAYDQIVHDVSIQNLPVRFAIDRGGVVGADGPTHTGSFDISFLANLPNFVVMAPSDAEQMEKMVSFAVQYNDGPIAFRYPRDNAISSFAQKYKLDAAQLVLGKGRMIKQGSQVAILSYGSCLQAAIDAADILEKNNNISCTIVDAQFCKPLDIDLIMQLSKHHELLVTVEEGAVGGFGAQVNNFILNESRLINKLRLRNICFPDKYLSQGDRKFVLDNIGLTGKKIAEQILSAYL